VIVVDEDIDPTNLREVMWAVATRSDPATDIDIIRQTWGSLVDPQFVTYTSANPAAAPFNSRAIIDACIPFDHRDDFPKPVSTSPELLEAVRRRWPGIEQGLPSP
jgi:3-polyprenyl-4-hydroxybenzoate decarboxylase